LRRNPKTREKLRRLTLVFLPVLLILLISGCAHVIRKEIRENSDLSLMLEQVRKNPTAHTGKSVVWGGEIVQVINQDDGTTEIEVFQEPLNFRGEPKEAAPSEGRFLVLDDRFLDPYIYWEGRRITVAGELQGERIEPLGEMYYRYPLIISKQIYLWPDFSPSPYYGYYPWSYYDPWWGYPYGWWGFGFYYHHHPHHHPHHYPGVGTERILGAPSRSGRPGFFSGIFGSRGFSGGRSSSSSGGGRRGHR
jgi:outer membrane lipoprotein